MEVCTYCDRNTVSHAPDCPYGPRETTPEIHDGITQEQAERYRDSWLHSSAKVEKLDAVLEWVRGKLSEQCDYDLEDELNSRWRAAHTDT